MVGMTKIAQTGKRAAVNFKRETGVVNVKLLLVFMNLCIFLE
jgi:hypothetical protein